MKFAVAARFALIALGFGFAASILVAAPVKLGGPLTPGGDVDPVYRFSADGSRILYVADQDIDQVFELYGVSSAGGAPQKLSGPLVFGGDVTDFQISPNGQRVVYRADADTDEEFNLYSVQLTANVAFAGDYNGNGVVDAADYTIWRDTLNSTTDLRANGDNSGASAAKIDQADYLFWKSHFGMHGGSGAETVSTVPEPASSVLLLLAGSAACATSFGRFFLDAGRSPSYSRQRLMANF